MLVDLSFYEHFLNKSNAQKESLNVFKSILWKLETGVAQTLTVIYLFQLLMRFEIWVRVTVQINRTFHKIWLICRIFT